MSLRAKYLKKQDLRDFLDCLLYDKTDYSMNAESFEENLKERKFFEKLSKQYPSRYSKLQLKKLGIIK